MFYGFSSSLLCGFRPPYIIFSIYIYYEIYISYSIFLSGSFDARSSPTHQRFLPWRILAFPAVLTAKMRFSTMGKCWGKPTNEVFTCWKIRFYVVWTTTFSGKSPAWHHQGTAWIGELLWTYWERCKLRLHQICPSAVEWSVLPVPLNSLLLSCHTEINHEKGWCIWGSNFWDTWELHIFVVLWRLRVVPPFGFFNKKVSHGLPPSAPRIIFVGLLPNLVGYMGGSIHWGYPNSWMEENGQSF